MIREALEQWVKARNIGTGFMLAVAAAALVASWLVPDTVDHLFRAIANFGHRSFP